MGWKDRWDVLQWMNIANEIFGDSTQMVVHGISMGGATTMMVSGEEQKPLSNALWRIAAIPAYGTNSRTNLKPVSIFLLFHSCIPQAGFVKRNMDGISKKLLH